MPPRESTSRIDPQPIVHLSWRAIRAAELVSFPTYPGAAGHSADGGTPEWGTATDQFLDTNLALGQFTILPRDRQFRATRTASEIVHAGDAPRRRDIRRGRIDSGDIG